MAKIKSPTARRYADEFLKKGTFSEKESEKNEDHIKEIGLRKFRLYKRIVEPIKWQEKWKIAEVLVDGKLSRYGWPFHNCYEPFFNFEVLDDIDYLERFGNGKRVNGRYGVKNGILAVDGKYLGTERFLLPRFSEMGILVEKEEKAII